ncbi:MAG: hypothetical protein ABEL76_17555 [Bradymonadaceae bacterium]
MTLPQKTNVEFIRNPLKPKGDESTDLHLYDAQYADIDNDHTSGSGKQAHGPVTLDAGVYVLRVEIEDKVDKLRLTAKLTKPPIAESEPNDSDGKATSVPVGREFTGSATSGDTDVFKIELKNKLGSSQVLGVGIAETDADEPGYDTKCKVRDSGGNTLESSSFQSASCGFFLTGLSKGTYFFEVSNGSSDSEDYEGDVFKTKGKPEQEPNDSFDKGTQLSVGSTGFGELPGVGMNAEKKDYWKIKVNNKLGSNEKLEVKIGNLFWADDDDLDVTLYKPDKSTQIDDSGFIYSPPETLESSTGLGAGTYYLEIKEDFSSFSGVDVARYRVDVSTVTK